MTVHSRRALRVTATLAGVAALGATFSGTAFAAEQDNSLHNSTGDSSEDYGDSGPLSIGPFSKLGGDFLDFELPTAGPSIAPTKKDDEDGDDSSDSSIPFTGGNPHHYHPGSQEQPYDFDLYSPTESYGENKCKSVGADRGPLWAMEGGFGGYNGDSAGDCKVDSGDYHPKRTGYKGGKDSSNGYNGYVGTDESKHSENSYLFKLPGS